ncbi:MULTISPECIES: sugar phosphate isomerase/epimerase family protein [unclassified Aureimonas]|uniref:sugar phosphate isomerase/epimerase family protein n=1 Tax=unclassified Aureimonas TaxID=2615206 RepID=UPI0007007A3E|nr:MULTISPECIES: TIM barrel protein [unclassified Aureimonas]KQT68991.1 xylose isomerase [Aureimonas sp. Leaf460]KQT69222.1 xylose isomerase [Aureimonas sp. Leaf427]
MTGTLRVYQSLWATELRRPGLAERPVEERFDAVAEAGYHGMAIDLGAMDIETARSIVPNYARTGLAGLLTAFPRSVEELRPALHLAKEIGSPFVVVVGQVMPVQVCGMVPVVREWLRIAAEEGVPIQFETHRASITNDLFATLQLLDAVPEMRLAADLSHYVVDREPMLPLDRELAGQVSRILARSDSFQGRVATRCQVQVSHGFPQHRPWLDLFLDWWSEGFRSWKARAKPDEDCIFLCELGPRPYAITGADDAELSDRWLDALSLRRLVEDRWRAA